MKKLFFLFMIIFLSCKSQEKKHKHTNLLINESSPYLLQHAYNPVNWHAWNKETLAKAKREGKLLLISIGYAACHWCHVMEHECFEDEDVAKIMNDNFICVKVDREERPDVDKIYMTACQMMTGSGGWPLNSVALPDGRPVWAGTYFPKKAWLDTLNNLVKIHKDDPNRMLEVAEHVKNGIVANNLVKIEKEPTNLSNKILEERVTLWGERFDIDFGGMNRSPKFPTPSNYQFLLRYAYQTNNIKLLDLVNTTLTKMAHGGIFDQVGGGFARYSVDKKWHIPHFEKMLYDNAQLVSLYSKAYQLTKNSLYKTTIVRTIEFLERELLDDSGAFYSSLDADSKNEKGNLKEGAFYVWTEKELKKYITDFGVFKQYYNINSYGKWENDSYHLIRSKTDQEFCDEYKITLEELNEKSIKWNKILLEKRSKRSRPRLDDKVLTAWNGLMITAYCDAYSATKKLKYLKSAEKLATFILSNMTKDDGGLYRNYKKGKSSINAFSQDYATVIEGFLQLYQVSFNEVWLDKANDLMKYSIQHFYDSSTGFFYFKSNKDMMLVAKTMETTDSVIPSSNAIMANNLFMLSHYFNHKDYALKSKIMLEHFSDQLYKYPSSASKWLQMHMNTTYPFYEVAITGEKCESKRMELMEQYTPNILVVGAKNKSKLELLKSKFSKNKTYIFVCQNKVCLLPIEDVEQATEQIKTK